MKQLFMLCTFCMVFAMLPAVVSAQIQQTSEVQHKKEQKRFLKEARTTESTYKDTHLNTTTYTYKKGESARKRAKKQDDRLQYKFDDTGKPQKKKGLFRKKATRKQAVG